MPDFEAINLHLICALVAAGTAIEDIPGKLDRLYPLLRNGIRTEVVIQPHLDYQDPLAPERPSDTPHVEERRQN